VVVLTQPKDFVKEKNPMLPFIKLKYKKFPKLIDTVANRHNIYNETTTYIKEKEKTGELFVIRPPEPLNIKSVCHDKNELLRVYNIGRHEAEKQLSALKEYLK
jgi:predicted patatin/cPLA2 family phospholipase